MFKEYSRDQEYLLPPSIHELLAPEDLAFTVAEVTDKLNISDFVKRSSHLGPNAYHPRMMLSLLFYAYSQKVFSSRRIAEHARYDVRFIYLAAHQRPDFRTISDFRKDNLDLVKDCFVKIVRRCQEEGLITLRQIAIDGTKIQADASTAKTKSRDTLAKELAEVEAEVARMLDWAQITDDEESLEAENSASNSIPEGVPVKDLLQKRDQLREAKARMDADPKLNDVNFTDPDSRLMKGGKCAYNAQLAVDARHLVIVAADVVNEANDVHQLLPMIEQVEENTQSRREPKTWLADAGYSSSENYSKLESRPEINAYIPIPQDLHRQRTGQKPKPFDKIYFTLDPVTGQGTCPLGQPMRGSPPRSNKRGRMCVCFRGTACLGCLRRSECTKSKFRSVELLLAEPAVERMRAKMRSAAGKRAMSIRRQTVEPVNGVLKEQMGFRRFQLRGLAKVKGEFLLLCCAYNLKKLHRQRIESARAQALCARAACMQPVVVEVEAISIFWLLFWGSWRLEIAGFGSISAIFHLRRELIIFRAD